MSMQSSGLFRHYPQVFEGLEEGDSHPLGQVHDPVRAASKISDKLVREIPNKNERLP